MFDIWNDPVEIAEEVYNRDNYIIKENHDCHNGVCYIFFSSNNIWFPNFTYGAMQLIVPRKKELYRQVNPAEGNVECDTFNCNCVLLSDAVIRKAGNFDPMYTHSLADLDYGLRLRRLGFHIYSSNEYVGICNKNSIKGTWADSSLSRRERLKKKESPKGAPCREWFHFMRKNFGFKEAVKYSVSPYARIMLGK